MCIFCILGLYCKWIIVIAALVQGKNEHLKCNLQYVNTKAFHVNTSGILTVKRILLCRLLASM